jgi:hypothetical protein
MLRHDAAARSSEPNAIALPSCGPRRHGRRDPVPTMTVLRRKPAARVLRMKSNITALSQHLKEKTHALIDSRDRGAVLQSNDPKLTVLLRSAHSRANGASPGVPGGRGSRPAPRRARDTCAAAWARSFRCRCRPHTSHQSRRCKGYSSNEHVCGHGIVAVDRPARRAADAPDEHAEENWRMAAPLLL